MARDPRRELVALEAPEGHSWERAALAAALLPFAITAVVLVVHRGAYLPVGDHALTELRVRDVGRHPVVAGLCSRDGWSHPGHMAFHLLAPLYRLAGSRSIAVDLGELAPIDRALRLEDVALGPHDDAFAWAVAVYAVDDAPSAHLMSTLVRGSATTNRAP